MVLYGFRAMYQGLALNNLLLPSDVDRLQVSDWDILCSPKEFTELYESFGDSVLSARPIKGNRYFIKTTKGSYDIHIVTVGRTSNNILYSKYISKKPSLTDKFNNSYTVVWLADLFLIKKSHRCIRLNFAKTMEDYHRLYQAAWDIYDSYNLYQQRLAETLERADRATNHINLDQSKDDFFTTKGVTYIYDHDSIHASIKLGAIPLYKSILKNGEDVICDMSKFSKLPYTDKLNLVLEEAYVIAIERYLSKGSKKTPYEAFNTALEKICTTLTKGKFREFAYENYMQAKQQYSPQFWDIFQQDLSSNKILPFKGK